MRSEITLKDIARETGLSVNTVSRALRGKADISAETTKRVIEVAKRMGYTRNDLASQLRTRKSGILGLVIADIANPVYSGVAKGVEAVAKREGYCVLVSDTEENADKEELAINMMLEKRVDGLLIVPTQQRDDAIVLLRNVIHSCWSAGGTTILLPTAWSMMMFAAATLRPNTSCRRVTAASPSLEAGLTSPAPPSGLRGIGGHLLSRESNTTQAS